jgi:hypothetical protein
MFLRGSPSNSCEPPPRDARFLVEKRIPTNILRHDFNGPSASPLNNRSSWDWMLLSCNFGDDISEQSERLLDPAVSLNRVVEVKSVVVAP